MNNNSYKEGDNYFQKYKVPQDNTPSYRVDPILKFFNGGFMMPAQEGGNINFPKERGYTPERMANGGDISIADLRRPTWLDKYTEGGPQSGRELASQNRPSRESTSITYYTPKGPVTTATSQTLPQEVRQFPRQTFLNPSTPYRRINATKANIVRGLLPLPKNAAQMVSKVVFDDARMNNESLSDQEKLILWNTIQNAQKRSGVVTGGGTEYQDYGNQGYGSPEEFNNWFNRGKTDVTGLIKNSFTNPGYRLASTIGRGRYWQDPKDPDKMYYTDVYDWNPSEKNFSGDNTYQKVRNWVRSTEDKNLDVDKNEKYRMHFMLTKSEMDRIKSENANQKKYGGVSTMSSWLDKYVTGGPSTSNYSLPNARDLVRQNQGYSSDAAMLSAMRPSAEVLDLARTNEMLRKQGEIKKAEPKRSAASKAWVIATNPVTALSYKVKGQDIPEHFERGEHNPYDIATNIINPLSYIETARQVKSDFGKGNYLAAGIGSLGLIPGEGSIEKATADATKKVLVGAAERSAPKFANWIEKEYEGTRIIPHITPSGSVHNIEFRNMPQQEGYTLKRAFDISDENDGGNLAFSIHQKQGEYPVVKNFAFFNENPESADQQLKLFMSGLSDSKVHLPGTGSTSMYSQPLMNTAIARMAATPGKINLTPIGTKLLNTAFYKTSPKTFMEQVAERYPKLIKSYDLLSRETGIPLEKPQIFLHNKPATMEDLLDPANALLNENDYPGKFRIEVPDYGIFKHFRQGGINKYALGGPNDPYHPITNPTGYRQVYTNPMLQAPTIQRASSESTSFGAANPQAKEQLRFQANQNAAYINEINNIMQTEGVDRNKAAERYNARRVVIPRETVKPSTARSSASKTWAVMSNPITALKYKMKGQDIPENFDKGERNAYDMAFDIINPATYVNAAGRTASNVAHPFSTANRLYKGTRDLAVNIAGDNAGWDNVLDAAGVVGDAALLYPGAKALSNAAKEFKPFISGASRTYGLTSDLPFATRVKNALNAGTLKYDLEAEGIDKPEYVSHMFSATMAPEEASAQIKAQKAAAPRGAKLGDKSMSLNSTPLYFTEAARGVNEFPIVRTGDYQGINTLGYKGKRIQQAIPERIYNDYPEIIQEYNAEMDQINQSHRNMINNIENDPSLSDVEKNRRINIANQHHKRSVAQASPQREAMNYIQNNPELFNEFASNYASTLDKPIELVNKRTGLNIPKTRYELDPNFGGNWEAPTIYSVKGSFNPRYKAIFNRASDKFVSGLSPYKIDVKVPTLGTETDPYRKELLNIQNAHNKLSDHWMNRLRNNEIDHHEYAHVARGLQRDLMNATDDLNTRYPDWRQRMQNWNPYGQQYKTIGITPPQLLTPGIINQQLGTDQSRNANWNGERNFLNSLINFDNIKFAGPNTPLKYGGSSLKKYPQGGSPDPWFGPGHNLSPTPQTGSSNQYGPTFSNQAGYTPPEDKRDKFIDFALNAAKLGLFLGATTSGLFKKRKPISQDDSSSKPSVAPTPSGGSSAPIDGNGKPIANPPDIAWNYNPARKAQQLPSPGLDNSNPGGQLYESTGMMARHGGDVSIYGRRNYSADTPSFFNFGGITNEMNIKNSNNWLKKYKS